MSLAKSGKSIDGLFLTASPETEEFQITFKKLLHLPLCSEVSSLADCVGHQGVFPLVSEVKLIGLGGLQSKIGQEYWIMNNKRKFGQNSQQDFCTMTTKHDELLHVDNELYIQS